MSRRGIAVRNCRNKWHAALYARYAHRQRQQEEAQCGGCRCQCKCDCKMDEKEIRAALIKTTPNIDYSQFQRAFRDGDKLPEIVTFEGGDADWLGVDVSDGSATRTWLEHPNLASLSTEGGLGPIGGLEAVLRVQFAPGVVAANIGSVVASRATGQSRALLIHAVAPFEYRTYDGSGNNKVHPTWGSLYEPLLRVGPAHYADGKSEMINSFNPRAISNAVVRYTGGGNPPPSADGLSDMVWGWGQFIDHEIDLTPNDTSLPAPVIAPANDPALPGGKISFLRSQHVVDDDGVWQQVNGISSFLDATNVYGPTDERAVGLRTLDGSGKMKMSHGNTLPPFNVGSVYPNANDNPNIPQQDQLLCGDVRANENPLLSALNSLFVLEHNRLCDEILAEHPRWKHDDERLFQEARRLVIAQMQHITMDHFLPTLFGEELPPYAGYDSEVRPDVCTEFSTALYRMGHTMVSNELAVRRGSDEKLFALADVFFNPDFIVKHGTGALLEGAAKHRMQEIDRFIVEALRNMLFGKPGVPANALHDLATLNLQRGVDHGICLYNDARESYGLARKTSFADMTSDVATQQALAEIYPSVDDVALWIGALCEDHLPGTQVGELSMVGVREQFLRIRDGDRFWYEGSLDADTVAAIKATTLADIIRRNTDAQVQDDVFRVPL